MKLLACSDLHGSKKAINAIVKKSNEADIVLILGDLTIFEQELKQLLAKFAQVNKPVLIIPGNHEHGPTLEKMCRKHENIIYMNGKIFENDEVLVFGLEGNGFTIEDKDFEKKSAKYTPLIKASKKKYILMTHAPPHETKLDKLLDGHCGNKSIRRFIEKTKPIFAFSGHIHENSGKKDKIRDTIVFNVGPSGRLVTL